MHDVPGGLPVDSDMVRPHAGGQENPGAWGSPWVVLRAASGLMLWPVLCRDMDLKYTVPQFWPAKRGEIQVIMWLLSGIRWYGHARSEGKMCLLKMSINPELSFSRWGPRATYIRTTASILPQTLRSNSCEIVLSILNLWTIRYWSSLDFNVNFWQHGLFYLPLSLSKWQ